MSVYLNSCFGAAKLLPKEWFESIALHKFLIPWNTRLYSFLAHYGKACGPLLPKFWIGELLGK